MAKEDTSGRGNDDPLAHDLGDDNGIDDPLTHDLGDDNGIDDPLTHDVGDDNGIDDPLTHDLGDDNGIDDPLTHDLGDDSALTTTDVGSRMDTVTWDLPSANFRLSFAGSKVVIADGMENFTELPDGTDRIQFADKTVIVESRAHGSYDDIPDSLYQFFIVAFDAAPGVEYMDQLAEAHRSGMSIDDIVEAFTTKTQFTDVYSPALSHDQFASQLVENVVKSSATSEAKQEAIGDITAALDAGWTFGEVIRTVFGNIAQMPATDSTWGNTARQFQNEVAVAKYYTEILNQSTTDLQTLKSVLDPVTTNIDISTGESIAQLVGVALIEG